MLSTLTTLPVLAVMLVVLIPVISIIVVAGLTAVALQFAIVLTIGGYLLGIPYAIGFRLVKGRWPQY